MHPAIQARSSFLHSFWHVRARSRSLIFKSFSFVSEQATHGQFSTPWPWEYKQRLNKSFISLNLFKIIWEIDIWCSIFEFFYLDRVLLTASIDLINLHSAWWVDRFFLWFWKSSQSFDYARNSDAQKVLYVMSMNVCILRCVRVFVFGCMRCWFVLVFLWWRPHDFN